MISEQTLLENNENWLSLVYVSAAQSEKETAVIALQLKCEYT